MKWPDAIYFHFPRVILCARGAGICLWKLIMMEDLVSQCFTPDRSCLLEPGERSRRHGKSRKSFALRPAALGNIARGEQRRHDVLKKKKKKTFFFFPGTLVGSASFNFFLFLSKDWRSNGRGDGANEPGRPAAHSGS